MQIRTLLILISILGAFGSALSVWYVSSSKEAAQKAAEIEVRWNIYFEAWSRIKDLLSLRAGSFTPKGYAVGGLCSYCLLRF